MPLAPTAPKREPPNRAAGPTSCKARATELVGAMRACSALRLDDDARLNATTGIDRVWLHAQAGRGPPFSARNGPRTKASIPLAR